jgi:DNA-binding NarL/FixJ family response regulator
MAPIRVLIADDHPPLRYGLRVLLEQDPGMQVIAEVSDGFSALQQIEYLQPDVAILDIRLPGQDGLEVARIVHAQGWPTRVLLLSAYAYDAYLQEAIAIGVEGYLLKNEELQIIVSAVRSVAQGLTVFSPALRDRIRSLQCESAEILTRRDLEILEQVARGKADKEIARHLGISERTVRHHLTQIFQKLQVRSRTEAVWVALRNGWISRLVDKPGQE